MAKNVWMHIEKFGRDVLIAEDHPLAVAQREKDADTAPESPDAESVATPRRRKATKA